MKKTLFLWSVIISLTALTNCRSNDNDDTTTAPVEKKILLSKITSIDYYNPSSPQTTVNTIAYNAKGQITEAVSGDSKVTFEYDATGKPTKTSYYQSDKTLEYYSTYIYNGDQLTGNKDIYSNPAFNRSTTYTYDSNGKLATSSLCQSENCTNPHTETYSYNGDNVSAKTIVSSGTINYTNKTESSYDDKPNPYTHMNKYLKISMGDDALSKNNVLSTKISRKESDGSWVQINNIIYTIQYNSDKFPVKVVGQDKAGNKYVEYNYEYIVQ